MLESILHQLGARLHAEVLHDRVFVKGDRARAYFEEVRDLLHRVAFREELQHFALSHSELLRGRLRSAAEEDAERHSFSNEWRDVSLARERPLDSGEELARRGVLQQIARCAQTDSVGRDVWIFIHREEDKPHTRHFSAKLGAGVYAVEPRHRDVENDHIGLSFGSEFEECAAVTGGPNDFAPWLQQTPEGVQQHRVVVGKKNAGAAVHSATVFFVLKKPPRLGRWARGRRS